MTQIRSIGSGRNFLNDEEIHRLHSIIALHESPEASSKYHFFSTLNILSSLKNAGWLPVKVQEQAIRTATREGFQKHLIRFRQQATQFQNVGDILPEIILINSHDTTSAFNFFCGLIRFVCINGLFVAESEFGSIHIPHLKISEQDVIDVSAKVIEDVPKLVSRIEDYKQIELKPVDKELFAEQALLLKYDEGKGEIKREGANLLIGDRKFSVPAILHPRREADQNNSLWTIFNIVQEQLTKGNGFERTVRIDLKGHIRHARKTREIVSIDEQRRVNQGLWSLMAETAEPKKEDLKEAGWAGRSNE